MSNTEDGVISARYDFIVLASAKEEAMIDGHGSFSERYIKQMVRQYVHKFKNWQAGFQMYGTWSETGAVEDRKPTPYLGLEALQDALNDRRHQWNRYDQRKEKQIRQFFYQNFFDARAFGMTITSVRGVEHPVTCPGAVQIGSGQAVDSSHSQVYAFPGAIGKAGSQKAGLSREDLSLLWNAFLFGNGAIQGEAVIVFSHTSVWGNGSRASLFDLVEIQSRVPSPRSFTDYTLRVNEEGLPSGVKVEIFTRSNVI